MLQYCIKSIIIIEEKRVSYADIQNAEYRSRASSARAYAYAHVKCILRIHVCADGHVTLHCEFQRGILLALSPVSPNLFNVARVFRRATLKSWEWPGDEASIL